MKWDDRRRRSLAWRRGADDARRTPSVVAPRRNSLYRPLDPQPSKAELRAEAAEATAEFLAAGGKVTRLATTVKLRCLSCGHRGAASVPPGRSRPRFRCSRCGGRDFRREP